MINLNTWEEHLKKSSDFLNNCNPEDLERARDSLDKDIKESTYNLVKNYVGKEIRITVLTFIASIFNVLIDNCRGNPLAIELMSEQIRNMTIYQLRRMLNEQEIMYRIKNHQESD